MKFKEKFFTNIFLIAFFFIFLISIFLPIYTDEPATHVERDLYLQNGGKLVSMLPQCISRNGIQPELFTAPISILSSMWNEILYIHSDPIVIRLVGMAAFLLWLFLFFLIIEILYPNSGGFVFSLALVPLSFGYLILQSVINRPEQDVIILVSFLTWWTLSAERRSKKFSSNLILSGFITICLIGFQRHLEFGLFFGVILTCLYFAPFSKLQKSLVTCLLFAILYSTHSFWNSRMLCPESAALEKVVHGELGLNMSFSGIARRLADGFPYKGALGPAGFSGFGGDFNGLLIERFDKNDLVETLRIFDLNPLIHLINWAILLLGLAFCFSTMFQLRIQQMPSRRNALAIGFFLAALALIVFVPIREFYRSVLVTQSLVMALILFDKPKWFCASAFLKRICPISCIFVFATSICSMIYLSYDFIPRIPRLLDGGPVKGSLTAFSPFQYAKWKKEITDLAEGCHIQTSGKLKYLVADDFTHEIFKSKERMPIYAVYLSKPWDENSIDNLTLLKNLKSSGAIGFCQNLLAIRGMQGVLSRKGDLCCLDPNVILDR